jgi:hypothetical protein
MPKSAVAKAVSKRRGMLPHIRRQQRVSTAVPTKAAFDGQDSVADTAVA